MAKKIHNFDPSGKFTNVTSRTHEKLGLFRRQARRHGMQTSDFGREPDRERVPRFKDISSAMSPGAKGKAKDGHGFGFSNMQPRGRR